MEGIELSQEHAKLLNNSARRPEEDSQAHQLNIQQDVHMFTAEHILTESIGDNENKILLQDEGAGSQSPSNQNMKQQLIAQGTDSKSEQLGAGVKQHRQPEQQGMVPSPLAE